MAGRKMQYAMAVSGENEKFSVESDKPAGGWCSGRMQAKGRWLGKKKNKREKALPF